MRNYTDDQIQDIANAIEYTIGWHMHEDYPNMTSDDYSQLYQHVDSCNSCSVYKDPCEFDENGDCDSCSSDNWEDSD